MKKHFSLVLTLALLVAVSFGCKVGAEDPASLGSRDGRIMASWKLTKIEGNQTSTDFFGTVTTTTITYDGTIYTEVSSPGGTFTMSYSLEMTLDKGGVLTTKETSDGVVANEIADWEWGNTDKKKSEVLLNCSTLANGAWSILRLSGKELILEQVTSRIVTNNGSTDTETSNVKLTFAVI
jgi:hypothetical protein